MTNNNAYERTLNYLYSFIDLSLTRDLRYSPEKFDLTRMKKLMDLLDNPQENFDIVHVAGTKGKGSTCAMVASILSAQGYRVGFYSSPHMIDFTERIRVNKIPIPRTEIVNLIESMREKIEIVKEVSTFEITTALAFQYFSEKEVDIAIVEVGMGGRLDATNIVHPVLTAITSVSLDHTKILGDTVAQIAREKAGIIKEYVPVVIARQTPEAKDVIVEIAKEKHSPIIDVESSLAWEQGNFSLKEQEFRLVEKQKTGNTSNSYILGLTGDHQLENALTAYAMIKNLPEIYVVDERAIKSGFRRVEWTGRFEVISKSPLIIIDGAHNPFSFEKLAHTIQKYLPGKNITLVFGASEDKDVNKMVEIIKPCVGKIIFTKSEHPRALTENEFLRILKPKNKKDFVFLEIEALAEEMLVESESVFIATGSIFIAGAIKQLIQSPGS